MDKRMFKKTPEELQMYMHFKKRHGVSKIKKGKGSYTRKQKHREKFDFLACAQYNRNIRNARLAQPVRAPALQAGGHKFESCISHQKTGSIPVRQLRAWSEGSLVQF